MAQAITQYTVFIGSRTGLSVERRHVFLALCFFSMSFRRDGIGLSPVDRQNGLEEGKPLAPQIEQDLRQSAFAVFLIDDRWSSSDAAGPMSVLAQQWALAEELYRARKLAGIAVLFNKVARERLAAPDDQLKAILDFRRKIEAETGYYIDDFASLASPAKAEHARLEDWFRSLTVARPRPAFAGLSPKQTSSFRIGAPNADYWTAEAWANVDGDTNGRNTALFCATNAVEAARGEVEQAKANNVLGIAQFRLGRADEALATLTAMADKLEGAFGGDRREGHATLLANKGLMLEALGRGSDAIAVYDDIITRFGSAYEQPVRECVASAQAGKARVLDASRSAGHASPPDDAASDFPERELEEAVRSLAEEARKRFP